MIIGTSFAPSPTDKVIHFPFFLAKATTSDFYLGDTRQQITELALQPKKKNLWAISSVSSTIPRVDPSITIDILS
jgi:hypothetical protein